MRQIIIIIENCPSTKKKSSQPLNILTVLKSMTNFNYFHGSKFFKSSKIAFFPIFAYQFIAPIFTNDLCRLVDELNEADILTFIQILEDNLDF